MPFPSTNSSLVQQLAQSQVQTTADHDGKSQRKSERDLVNEMESITRVMGRIRKYLEDPTPKDPRDMEVKADSMMVLENQRNALAIQLGNMRGEIERQLQMQSRAPEIYTRGFGGTEPAAQDTMQALIMGLQQLQSAGELALPGGSAEERDEAQRLAELGAEKERMFRPAESSPSRGLSDRLRELLKQEPWKYRPQAGGRGYFDYE